MITQIKIDTFKDLGISTIVYEAELFKNPIMFEDYREGIDSNTPIANHINLHVINKWNAKIYRKYMLENVIDNILINKYESR
jgi:hypothetical protein